MAEKNGSTAASGWRRLYYLAHGVPVIEGGRKVINAPIHPRTWGDPQPAVRICRRLRRRILDAVVLESMAAI